MGSSLVASSSSKVNMADWEHGAGILNSSNEEEEEDEGCEQGVRSPLTARWLGATAFDSPHLYQIQPASSQMPFGNVHQMDSVVSASVDTLPFPSIAAQSHPINDDYMQFLTFGGAQKKIKQEDDGAEFHDDDEDDDDKKPAARKTEESEDDDKKPAARRTEESDDEKPPNHTRHSLSKDPFHEHESAPEFSPDDQFINPSLSFVDEEDLRTHGGNFSLAGWSAAHDLALQQQQHTGYGARAPLYAPPLTYTLGDRVPAAALLYPPPPAPESPPLRVGSAARVATRRSTAPLRQGGALRRRKATVAELTAAGTDRARAAVMTWYDRFNDLVEYSEMYGNCNVPQKYPPNPQLGIWVNKQRMEKKFIEEGKRTSMNDMKLEALESIGFTWAKRKGEASWMHKYHELEAFLRKHGHCNVATKYAPNPALGRWVSTQRSEYKKFQKSRRSGGGGNKSKHMTQTKIDMLNGLGFKWEMLPNRSSGSSSNGSNSGED